MDAFQQLAIVGVVLATLAGTLWTLQRKGLLQFAPSAFRSRSERKLQIVERLQLTPQHSLCLVQLDGRTLLIGTAPSSCTVLDQEGSR